MKWRLLTTNTVIADGNLSPLACFLGGPPSRSVHALTSLPHLTSGAVPHHVFSFHHSAPFSHCLFPPLPYSVFQTVPLTPGSLSARKVSLSLTPQLWANSSCYHSCFWLPEPQAGPERQVCLKGWEETAMSPSPDAASVVRLARMSVQRGAKL